jgi:hypothetical protein
LITDVECPFIVIACYTNGRSGRAKLGLVPSLACAYLDSSPVPLLLFSKDREIELERLPFAIVKLAPDDVASSSSTLSPSLLVAYQVPGTVLEATGY